MENHNLMNRADKLFGLESGFQLSTRVSELYLVLCLVARF